MAPQDDGSEYVASLDEMYDSPVLVKALTDQWRYAMQLRTGQIFSFSYADSIDAEWVHLVEPCRGLSMNPEDFQDSPFTRGVDIRVSDIVWIADIWDS